MKKLVMAILIMAGISGMAQDRNMRGQRDAMKDLTPEQTATLQAKKMTLALDLNESQQTKVIAMLTKDAKTRQSKMEASKKRKEGGTRMSKDERFAMQNERLDQKILREKEMKSLLTSEQYAKWEKMKTNKKRGRKKEKGSRRS